MSVRTLHQLMVVTILSKLSTVSVRRSVLLLLTLEVELTRRRMFPLGYMNNLFFSNPIHQPWYWKLISMPTPNQRFDLKSRAERFLRTLNCLDNLAVQWRLCQREWQETIFFVSYWWSTEQMDGKIDYYGRFLYPFTLQQQPRHWLWPVSFTCVVPCFRIPARQTQETTNALPKTNGLQTTQLSNLDRLIFIKPSYCPFTNTISENLLTWTVSLYTFDFSVRLLWKVTLENTSVVWRTNGARITPLFSWDRERNYLMKLTTNDVQVF